MSRVGIGYDSHRLVAGRPLIIGGVEIEFERGLSGHSDADVLAHAVTDAVLGAAGAGDIGTHFPPSDERWTEPVIECVRSELALIAEEERLLSLGVRVPDRALRVAVGGKVVPYRERVARGRAPPAARAGPIGLSAAEEEAMFARVRAERSSILSGAA